MRQRARGLAHRGAGVLILALNSGSPTTVAGVNFPPPNLRPYPLSASPAASYLRYLRKSSEGAWGTSRAVLRKIPAAPTQYETARVPGAGSP